MTIQRDVPVELDLERLARREPDRDGAGPGAGGAGVLLAGAELARRARRRRRGRRRRRRRRSAEAPGPAAAARHGRHRGRSLRACRRSPPGCARRRSSRSTPRPAPLEPHDARADRALARRQPDRGLVPPVRPPARAPASSRRRAPVTEPAAAHRPGVRAARGAAARIPPVPKAGHNIKYDWQVLRRAGVELAGVAYDSMLASFVLDPGRRSHAIDALALEHLGQTDADLRRPDRAREEARSRSPRCRCRAPRRYCGADSATVLALHEFFAPRLARHGARAAARRHRDAAGRRAGGHGVGRHRHRPARSSSGSSRELGADLAGSSWRSRAAAGDRAQPQLAEAARRRCSSRSTSCRCSRRPRPGPPPTPTCSSSLPTMGHELPQLILEYRELQKLKSTYVDVAAGARSTRGPGGSTPASTRPARPPGGSRPPTRTSRTSRSARRAARRSGAGSSRRRAQSFVVADYSQIELRLMAHLSGDPAFIEAFRAGRRHPPPDGGAHLRRAGRRGDAGDARPRQDDQLRDDLRPGRRSRCPASSGSRRRKPRRSSPSYFERFAGVRAFLDRQVELAREQGYVETLFKRRRYIPEIQRPELQHPRVRRAHGPELAASGVGRRPDQDRDDPHPPRAARARARQPDAAPGARRAGVRGAGGGGGGHAAGWCRTTWKRGASSMSRWSLTSAWAPTGWTPSGEGLAG